MTKTKTKLKRDDKKRLKTNTKTENENEDNRLVIRYCPRWLWTYCKPQVLRHRPTSRRANTWGRF